MRHYQEDMWADRMATEAEEISLYLAGAFVSPGFPAVYCRIMIEKAA